jgi:hypothetical protein
LHSVPAAVMESNRMLNDDRCHVLPDQQVIEKTVIEAIRAASATGAKPTRDTEVFQLVDSLGLVTALANIQAALQLSLEPEQLIAVFACRSIGDLTITLESALSAQLQSSANPSAIADAGITTSAS